MTYSSAVLTTCIAAGIVGSISAIVGCFLFLQRKSLFGDTIAHATFPGLTCMFFLTMSKNSLLLLIGGICSALCATYYIHHIQEHTTLKRDTILGIILAGSFGIGTMVLSKIQSMMNIHQAGITKYLLGNPATILNNDVVIIAIASLIVMTIIMRYIKPYTIMLFDPTYARIIRIPTTLISCMMLMATTIIIVLGLQIVGIILMSALLINPAAAAYQWTKKFSHMMILASCSGASCTIIGTILSSFIEHMPTGPMIVLLTTAWTIFSVLLSPQGVFITWFKQRKHKKQLSDMTLLSRFLLFNEGTKNPDHAHNIAALEAIGKSIIKSDLIKLQKKNLITSPKPNFWKLTPKGLQLLQNHIGQYRKDIA